MNIKMFRYFSVLAIIYIGSLFSCKTITSANEKMDHQLPVSKIDSVPAFIVKKQAIQQQLQLPAELLPLEKAEIVGKIQGYLRQIYVDIGDKVKKGQVLALIDAPEMKANLQQAKARLGEIEAKYTNSQAYYNRLTKASQVKGTISENELSQAYTQMQADSASIAATYATIKTYVALNNYLAITAPFSGIVTHRSADVGKFLSGSDATPILIIENNRHLRLRLEVPEQYSNSALQKKSLSFQPQAQSNKTYEAKYSRQSGSIDPVTRSETWEFLYDNIKNDLKSGMYVNVNIDFGRNENGIAVPNSAIATNLEKKYVIVVQDGKTLQIPVRAGFKMKDQTEIFGAINEGDILLTKPNDEIKDGSAVVVKMK